MVTRFGLTFALAAVTLCTVSTDAAAQKKKQRDVITQEEIKDGGQLDRDLGSAIRSLRPHFLAPPRGVRTMGAGMIYPLVLYVDGIRQPDIDALVSVMAKDVREVRYLEPSQSSNAYGITANGGAIVVKTLTAREKE